MAIGYQGVVYLNNQQFVVTGGGLNHERPVINSEGSYAAATNQEAVGRVHLYDFDNITGDLSFDTTPSLIDELFHAGTGWINQRQDNRTVLWFNNSKNSYTFGDTYWQNVSLSTSAGNLLTTNISLEMIPDHPSALPAFLSRAGDDYINQKFGFSDIEIPGGTTQPLTFKDPATRVIPYWQTSLSFVPATGIENLVTEWSLSVTNNFTKQFTCEGDITGNHPGPKYVFVGVAEVSLDITFSMQQLGNSIVIPEELNAVFITVSDGVNFVKTIELDTVELQNDPRPLAGQGDFTVGSYNSIGFFNLPRLI